MKLLQDKLNAETKPKRETSFHEGTTRKAKEKCKEGFRSCSSRSSRSSSNSTNGKRKDREASGGLRGTPAPVAVKPNQRKKTVSTHVLYTILSYADHIYNWLVLTIFFRTQLRKMIFQMQLSLKQVLWLSSSRKIKAYILILIRILIWTIRLSRTNLVK